MASSEEDGRGRILSLESEEDRKILMKVKSEEGKILKLKKQYVAAYEAGMLDPPEPTVMKAASQLHPSGKKTKKVVVQRVMRLTKVQIDFTKTMAARPSPTPIVPEDELAKRPKSSQYVYRQAHRIRNARQAFVNALVDQQERFGFAVDESEAEVTDDEGDNVVVNLVVI